MSWSVSIIGVPDKICHKLDEYGDSLTGVSKQEFEEVKDALKTLVCANIAGGMLITLNANGHANINSEGIKTYSQCGVSLGSTYTTLAV